MAQTLVARFKESPFSPWGLSRGTTSPLLDATPRFQSVGCISSVNSQVVQRGLQRRDSLPLLIADSTTMQRARAKAGQRRPVTHPRTHKPKTDKVVPQENKTKTAAHATSPGKEDKQADAKLIEFATFPGYTPAHPTPLPHGMLTLEQMKRVTRAQTGLAIKHDGYRECWKRLFYSPTSQAIFQDTFWWFFLHKYQCNQEIQKQLFGRVAVNYVKLLCELIEERWRDVFFKSYPDVIAQCVYSTFIYAFPTSWNNFDDEFKNELCNIVSLWQVGTQVVPNSWQKWNLAQLEPPNLLKHVSKEEKSPKSTQKGFNLDALVREAKEKEREGCGQKTALRINELTHYPIQLGESFSTPASTASKQDTSSSKVSMQEREDRKTISLAQLERALTVESRRLQQLQLQRDMGDLQTHGETTPPTESTSTQQRRIEVAREQLVDLKRALQLKKAQQARKGKAATAGSNANTGTTAANSQAAQRSSQTKPAGLVQQKSQAAPGEVQQNEPPKAPAFQQQQPQQTVFRPPPPPPVVSCSTSQKTRIPAVQTRSRQQLPPPFQKQSQPKPQQKPPVPLPQSQQQPTQRERAETQQTRSHQRSVLNAGATSVSSTSPQGEHNRVTGEGQAIKGGGGDQQKTSSGTWKEKALALRKTSVPTAGPKFDHVVFDIHGHSPLVKQYLQERNLSYDTKYSLLTKRTEIGQQPPPDAPTFEDLLRESIQEDKKNRAHFKKQYARQKQAMAQSQYKRNQATAQHEQDVKKVLSNKREVKQLSNELTAHVLSNKGGDKKVVAANISETLKRVSKSIN